MKNEDRLNMSDDMKMDNQLQKLAQQYADSLGRSADENDTRATIRENAEKLGVPSKSFQAAVSMVKLMTPGERSDYSNGVNRMLQAIGSEQTRAELFPEIVEAEKRRAEREKKREAERKASEGRSGEEMDADSDKNPRSNPEAGGAKPKKPKGTTAAIGEVAKQGEAMIRDQIARNSNDNAGKHGDGTEADLRPPAPPTDEQAEGEAALDAGLQQTKSQSQLAQEKRAKAGLN